jgi:glycerol-3-phosphate dehydrogenase
MIQIAIIGVGLIGASLGMALRSAPERESPLGAITVTGFDLDPRTLAEARGRLAIDREARTLADAVRDAHLVIVATPVQAIRQVFADLAPLLPPRSNGHRCGERQGAGSRLGARTFAHNRRFHRRASNGGKRTIRSRRRRA